jgi:hypothetical protein
MTSDQVQGGSQILGIVGVIYRYSDLWIVVESAGDLTTAPWWERLYCPRKGPSDCDSVYGRYQLIDILKGKI